MLAAMDGWASLGSPLNGGADAVPEQVWRVSSRRELIAALNDGRYPPPAIPSDTPKRILVTGRIDGNVDDANRPLGCSDYQRDGYTLQRYLAAFHPSVWGRRDPAGALESARLASQQAQQARVQIRVGSNTTLSGIGPNATLRGVSLLLGGAPAEPDFKPRNIIIRNLHFEDTVDCFPQWSPTDDAHGNWNAQYDTISVRGAEQVWITHNRLSDRFSHDRYLPKLFGRPFQVHDGLLDVSHGADRVTVSWNHFADHDKAILIGSSDSHSGDAGKLRVTLHHNRFERLVQRAPRVRYGQVHVYNNLYVLGARARFEYAFGVGVQSAIVAEHNAFESFSSLPADRLIARWGGTAITTRGNTLNGAAVDLRGAWNASNDPDLTANPTTATAPYLTVDPVDEVPERVRDGAGPRAR